MNLHTLKSPPGARKARRRVGRGPGSGRGKTSARGQKGQYARSKVNRHFEGGQTPIYRRLPRRGFNNSIFKTHFHIVNVSDIADRPALAGKSTIGPAELVEAGLIRDVALPVKVLGDGKLGRALTIQAHKFSKAAQEKILAAGGKAVVIGAAQ
jgi:large subunit ribosomal protein L15